MTHTHHPMLEFFCCSSDATLRSWTSLEKDAGTFLSVENKLGGGLFQTEPAFGYHTVAAS